MMMMMMMIIIIIITIIIIIIILSTAMCNAYTSRIQPSKRMYTKDQLNV